MEKEVEKDLNKNKGFLYIFLHIPKTGGSTIRYHIKKNFNKDEILELYSDNKNLRTKQEIYEHIKGLTKEERRKIKIIFGHNVYYGIHEMFDKNSRYITFVRNPIMMTISWYKYFLTQSNKGFPHPKIRKELSKENEVISFPEFLDKYEENNNLCHSLYSFLQHYLEMKDINSKINTSQLKKGLHKFYFIGLTKNPKDFLYLYWLLGIKKFYNNKNISKNSDRINKDKNIKKELFNKNRKSLEIYKHAIKLNRDFKNKNDNIEKIIILIKIRRFLSFFRIIGSLILDQFYEISSKLKKKSKVYSKLLNLIKGINEKDKN